jgi:hypothetical protein
VLFKEAQEGQKDEVGDPVGDGNYISVIYKQEMQTQ